TSAATSESAGLASSAEATAQAPARQAATRHALTGPRPRHEKRTVVARRLGIAAFLTRAPARAPAPRLIEPALPRRGPRLGSAESPHRPNATRERHDPLRS